MLIEKTDVKKTISKLTLQIAVYGETITRRAGEKFPLATLSSANSCERLLLVSRILKKSIISLQCAIGLRYRKYNC